MKKAFSATLALVMLFGLFAGCAGTAENAEASASASAPAQTVSDAPSPAASEAPAASSPEAAEFQAPSAEPSATSPAQTADTLYKLPLTDEKVTLSYYFPELHLMPPFDTLYETWDEFPTTAKAEEMTNVHIDYTTYNMMTATEQLALIVASGDYYDLMSLGSYSGGLKTACEEDIIYDLTDYVDQYAPNYMSYINANQDLYYGVTIEGRYYSLNSFYQAFRQNKGLVIRQDWLDELGLEAPVTYDDLTSVMTAFHEAYDTSCTMTMSDQLYIDGITSGYEINPAISAPGYIQRDGVVEASILTEGFRDYIQMMRDWYAGGLLEKDFISQTFDPNGKHDPAVVGSDDCGIWTAMYEFIDEWYTYNDDPDFEVVPIANIVKNPGDVDHVTNTSLMSDSMSCSVTTACDNVELAVSYLDFWFSHAGAMLYSYGIEGVTYNYNDQGEPELTDLVLKNEEGVSFTNFLRTQCPYGNGVALYMNLRVEPYLSDLARQGWDVWTGCMDGAYTYPTGATLTSEESYEVSTLATDIGTLMSENLALFIVGDKPMEDWDAFIQEVKGMGIQTCVDTYQTALERYYGK